MNAFQNEVKWSVAEKKAARTAFEMAYRRQCAVIDAKVKQMIAEAPEDLLVIWRIHDYLSEERRRTDKIFDYRYSVLLTVFGRLLSDGWLTEADLANLSKDKMEQIRQWASW